jgi:hypothetical protein
LRWRYAKDLAVAGKISVQSIIAWSELFYRYVQGDLTVGEDQLRDIMPGTEQAEQPSGKVTSSRKRPASRTLEGVIR